MNENKINNLVEMLCSEDLEIRKLVIKFFENQYDLDFIMYGLSDLNTYKYKYSHSVNGFYPATENVEWTTGFWTGEIWLAYELSGNTRFKDSALIQVDSFLNRIINKIDVNHHDMGFLYSPSCVAAYKLTGSEKGKKAA